MAAKRPARAAVETPLARAIVLSIAREAREVVALWREYEKIGHEGPGASGIETEIGRRLTTLNDYVRMQAVERRR